MEDDRPPGWCDRRGWTRFLLTLGEADLHRCEEEGLAACASSIEGVPADLVSLALDVLAQTALPSVRVPAAPELAGEAIRSVSTRKLAQLGPLLAALDPMAAKASRIVDFGSGSGHLTRLAADCFATESIGLERNADRVKAAERAALRSPSRGPARFVTVDASRGDLALEASDLALALHPCGELGDHMTQRAAETGCDLALVSCCPQKIRRPERAPLSRAGARLAVTRESLGLANLTQRPVGVEVSLEATLAARETRVGLQLLLEGRGLEIAPGEEMRGINRRRARAGLEVVARAALARRGLPAPTRAEIDQHQEEAARRYARIRRLSLPRAMLARLLEIAVVSDRAAALEESGHAVRVATVFDLDVTPRNIGLFAARDAARLPAITAGC